MNPISQTRLKEILDYDPITGIFTWKERIADKVNVGARAGSLHPNGYRFIGLFGKTYREHRLAFLYMLGYFPPQVDHADHNRSNNSWINLEESSYEKNGKNHPKTKRNTTGVVGVSQGPDDKYVARIYVNKKHIFLGTFASLSDAAKAREEAKIKHGFHPKHGK